MFSVHCRVAGSAKNVSLISRKYWLKLVAPQHYWGGLYKLHGIYINFIIVYSNDNNYVVKIVILSWCIDKIINVIMESYLSGD